MAFNVTVNLSKLLECRRACKMGDLPKYISRNGKAVIDSSDNFEVTSYQIYALIKHDQNYKNWRLSLRSYDFNPITETFTPLETVIPDAWQTNERNMILTKTILGLLSEDNIIFVGRPSLRNTSIIKYNKNYPADCLRRFGEILTSSNDCRIFVTC